MGAALAKGVAYNPDGSVRECLFCDICADKPGLRQTEVAYEDDRVVVFSPLERCAAQHWLVRACAWHGMRASIPGTHTT